MSFHKHLLIFVLTLVATGTIRCNTQEFPHKDPKLQNRQTRLDEVIKQIAQIKQHGLTVAIAALKHKDHRVRRAAVLKLGASSKKLDNIDSKLIAMLKDKHPRVKTAAARALAMRKNPDAIDPLVCAVADQNRKVRLWAWLSLMEFDLNDVFPVLIFHLSKKAPTNMLGYKDEIGNKVYLRIELNRRIPTLKTKAVQPMIESLDHDDEWVRGSAILILRDIGPAAKDALPALALFVDKKNQHHAAWAAEALGKIGDLDPAVMPALKNASENKNKKISGAAKKAIREIEKREKKK